MYSQIGFKIFHQTKKQFEMFCQAHQMQAIIYDGRLSFQQQFLCNECAKQQQIFLIKDYYALEQQTQRMVEAPDPNQILLKDLVKGLQQYKLEVQKVFEKISFTIVQSEKTIQQSNSKVPTLKHKTIKKEKTKDSKKQKLQILDKVKETLNKQLTELQNASQTDQLFEILNNYSPQMDLEILEFNQKKAGKSSDKKLNYQIIRQSNYFQTSLCQAIAFNSNTTLMIAGCYSEIKLFEFHDGKPKIIQILKAHSEGISVLQFLKKSNQFISASNDSTIIIWECFENNKWGQNQFQKCLVINENEEMMMSGSSDKTIKFWVKLKEKWIQKQSIDCQSEIYSICLNQTEDILIASLESKQIFVIQFQEKKWIIKQKIDVEQYGHRVCYINQNQFVFQPIEGKYLQFYDFDSKDQTFKTGQKIKYFDKTEELEWFFPIRYIKQLGLILVKDGHFLHIIRQNKNDQFEVDQSINFETDEFFGTISDDGKYIATYDCKTCEFQIRKLQI